NQKETPSKPSNTCQNAVFRPSFPPSEAHYQTEIGHQSIVDPEYRRPQTSAPRSNVPTFGTDDGRRSWRATRHGPERSAVSPLFCRKPSRLRLFLVTRLVTRFHAADDR